MYFKIFTFIKNILKFCLNSSDSDTTDCPTDFDTGQDGGDECDTDDLLDIDFIDTGSMQEVFDKDKYKNTGSCSYHPLPNQNQVSATSDTTSNKKSLKVKKLKRTDENGSKRKKKYVRTRKKQSDSHTSNPSSNVSPRVSYRGCRSVGGTPVSLRRNQTRGENRNNSTNMSPLSNRSNSLTFTEVYSIHTRMLALSDSEKALLKADLEADFKYKQLIHEAETILVSMKTTAVKEPPSIASPRRICNPPANKRVEMLRNDEVELKRELSKTQNLKSDDGLCPNEGVIVNKRLEILKHEPTSAPNSPKASKNSPLKTHVTNFINQNVDPNAMVKKKIPPDPPPRRSTLSDSGRRSVSPILHVNGRVVPSTRSPMAERRRFRSHSLQPQMESDSESEDVSRCSSRSSRFSREYRENGMKRIEEDDYGASTEGSFVGSRNIARANTVNVPDLNGRPNPPLISFRSVDIGYSIPDVFYCPQSEPLKRKVYSCSSTYDRIQKKLDKDQGKFSYYLLDQF